MCLFSNPSKRLIRIAHSFECWKEESCERGYGVGGLLVGWFGRSFHVEGKMLCVDYVRSIRRHLAVVVCLW